MNAFEAKLIALLPRLRSFALGLTLDSAMADDLVQAGCERALLRRHQWQSGTRLDSWMFKILRNLWIDHVRALPREGVLVDESVLDSMSTEWDSSIEDSLHLQQVLDSLAKLPYDMRAVLTAVCVEDLSYRETAEVLGVPIGTVMSRLARARVALHKLLGETHGPLH